MIYRSKPQKDSYKVHEFTARFLSHQPSLMLPPPVVSDIKYELNIRGEGNLLSEIYRKVHYSFDGENPVCGMAQMGLAGVDLTPDPDEITCLRMKCKEYNNVKP